MTQSNIISQQDAVARLDDPQTLFIDSSWYLPDQYRDAAEEYKLRRIPGAVFFDIDQMADPDTDLPHMMLHPDVFADVASTIGIGSDMRMIIYDGPGLFSAARGWWTFKTMGVKDVQILEGGFDAWKAGGQPIENGTPRPRKPAVFKANMDYNRVASLGMVEANVRSAEAIILDARPYERFVGSAPEPRPGLRSGHIPGSLSLAANKLVKDGKLVNNITLERYFNDLDIDRDTPVITTCGSGVTAAIISLALVETGRNKHSLFDGSWAQWGKPDGPEVASYDD